MKVKCFCGKEGHLQMRRKSARVQHYLGFKDGKRVYEWHKLPFDYFQMVVNGSKKMEVKNAQNNPVEVRGVGFEPTNPCGIAASVNLALFKEWLYRSYRPFTARMRFFYGKKYGHCLVNMNLSELRFFSDSKREHVLKALSCLAKFLGLHDRFLRLVKSYGLKWSGRSNDDIIISRLIKNVDAEEIFQWIRGARTKIPQLRELLELMAITGLRLIEAVESCNLIIRLSREGRLSTYYNEEKESLEHFRFKETFIRNSKKVFISFVPSELVKRIAERKPLDYDKVQRVAEYRMKRLRFADIRELHASLMVRHLREPEIDFLQGRVSASVFALHYFNVNLISDLKRRAFKGIDEIEKAIQGYPPASSGENGNSEDDCQKIVNESELSGYLARHWHVVCTLPSGKIVVSDE